MKSVWCVQVPGGVGDLQTGAAELQRSGSGRCSTRGGRATAGHPGNGEAPPSAAVLGLRSVGLQPEHRNRFQTEVSPDVSPQERLMDEGMEDEESAEEGGGGPEDRALAAAQPEPSLLTTAWSFISTFFTSLLPERPPHMAN